MDSSVLELMASRICHDLISPVGAVHNGVEFLEDAGPDDQADAISLIAHSAQQAGAKLQMFRMIYGAGGRDPNIKPEDVKRAFGNLIDADKKVKQDWDHKAVNTADLPLGFCKILAGTLMLAQECLPKGGTVKVVQDGGKVTVNAEGTDANARVNVKEALGVALPVESLDPRLVHPYIMGVLAKSYGYSLVIASQETGRVAFSIAKA